MPIKKYIRTIPDHPKKGILFRDISTLLNNPEGFQLALDLMINHYRDMHFDRIATIEARGFLFAAPLAYELHSALVLIRKKGKLPGKTISRDYSLEYGTNTLEISVDAIKPGEKILLIDDLLATAGTTQAAIELIESCGAQVTQCAFAVELPALNGRQLLQSRGLSVFSLCQFDGE